MKSGVVLGKHCDVARACYLYVLIKIPHAKDIRLRTFIGWNVGFGVGAGLDKSWDNFGSQFAKPIIHTTNLIRLPNQAKLYKVLALSTLYHRVSLH